MVDMISAWASGLASDFVSLALGGRFILSPQGLDAGSAGAYYNPTVSYPVWAVHGYILHGTL